MLPTLLRTAVLGVSGSGKTTFARSLAMRRACPHIELDALHWQANWTETPLPQFRQAVENAIASPHWVLDGNYSKVRDLVWARADSLIWLNYPFHLVFGRVFKRTCQRVFLRQALWAGNRETFRLAFLSRHSILWWVVKTYARRRAEYPLLFAQPAYQHLHILQFHTPAQAQAYLESTTP